MRASTSMQIVSCWCQCTPRRSLSLCARPRAQGKVELELAPLGRLAKVVPSRRSTDITQNVGSKSGGPHSLKWLQPPRTVLLVMKPDDRHTLAAAKRVISHLRKTQSGVRVLVEKTVKRELEDGEVEAVTMARDLDSVDLAVCLGGDGTALHCSSLFSKGAVPPVLGLSLGTLGFLMPYAMTQIESALDDVFGSRAAVLLRMRLKASLHDSSGADLASFADFGAQAMNEIHLHRGRHPHMTAIETYVDGQLLTAAVADGLIVSTPTGSTAYSLSAGGPIVHPSVQSLVLTPISPRSLSFRPVLLPPDVCITLKISPSSRSPAEISLDGREVRLVQPTEQVRIAMSPYPVPCLVPMPSSLLSDDWVGDINAMLSFNRTFARRGLPDESV